MSERELLNQISDRLVKLEDKIPPRENGKMGFMAEKLKLNVGTVVSLGGLLIMCTIYLTTQLSQIKEGWKVSEQRLWAHRLHLENPSINSPDVDEIHNHQQ